MPRPTAALRWDEAAVIAALRPSRRSTGVDRRREASPDPTALAIRIQNCCQALRNNALRAAGL
ncbi:MAG: hypothetical protein LC749_02865 [Actinobacteria bacterium]|nr:hypothetical protein [Actinomycetota bacterium]